MVAFADPPYCHCELQFQDSDACSIYMGSPVVMKKRTFDDSHYTAVRLVVTETQSHRAKALCSQKVARGVRFSSMQMLVCVSTWHASDNPDFTFCSKLVADVLVHADVLPSTTNCHITPSALYRLLRSLEQSQSRACEPLELVPGFTLDI
jgi:hypothetical protein